MSMFALPMDLWLSGISHNSQIRWEIAFCGFTPAFYPQKASSHFLYNHQNFSILMPLSYQPIWILRLLFSYPWFCGYVSGFSELSVCLSGHFAVFSLIYCFWSFNLSILFNQIMIISHIGSFAMNYEHFFLLIFPHFPSKAVINKL